MRQKLLKLSNPNDPDPKKGNLLETYMRIVKTWHPDEIELFSKIERQKLVELLCTNQDLLNFMFDKVFMSSQQVKPSSNE